MVTLNYLFWSILSDAFCILTFLPLPTPPPPKKTKKVCSLSASQCLIKFRLSILLVCWSQSG